jgi:hypothetical protein
MQSREPAEHRGQAGLCLVVTQGVQIPEVWLPKTDTLPRFAALSRHAP